MNVRIYALSTCPYCRMTREFLDEKGVKYEVIEVDLLAGREQEDAIAAVEKISGGTSFPVVCKGDDHVVGYDKARIEELLGL